MSQYLSSYMPVDRSSQQVLGYCLNSETPDWRHTPVVTMSHYYSYSHRKSEDTMPLGTPNFHQMVTPGAIGQIPKPKTQFPHPQSIKQSQATMPLGTPNFHQISMVTAGAIYQTQIPKPKTIKQSQATMPLGTPNFHQMSMVTPGAICQAQNPNPQPKTPTQNSNTKTIYPGKNKHTSQIHHATGNMQIWCPLPESP